MLIKTAVFISSSTQLKQCPKPVFPEYAFIGRSNVGKSSLLNMITGVNGLAKISSQPGKTQLINHFLINNNWYLVDLPGYGYAKISKSKRTDWQTFVENYIVKRDSLLALFVLIDIRLEPQAIDLAYFENLSIKGIPFVIVFTKSDKLTKNELAKNLANYKRVMLEKWEDMPQSFVTSSITKTGRDEILKLINETNKLFVKPTLSKTEEN